MFLPTLRETPAEAAIPSHQLLLRAGYIRQTAAGVYNYLPIAVRVLNKIEKLVDLAMTTTTPAGQKVSMPLLLGADLWKKTGRWETTGDELIRLRDRHQHEYCLGPTHEEVVTDLVANNVFSHKDLPVALYQIGRKYRDERRPRYGLMRSREFIMKDMYSFDKTVEEAHATYESVRQAYHNVFKTLGLKYVEVEADTGNIGGSLSHEFQILADVGEDDVLICDCGQYAANAEKATSSLPPTDQAETVYYRATKVVDGGEGKGGDEARGLPVVRATVPQGRSVNMVKLLNVWNALLPSTLTVQDAKAVDAPHAEGSVVTNVVDLSVARGGDGVAADVVLSEAGDGCAQCDGNGALHSKKGIEVGHIFYLGKKYSSALGAKFTNANGRPEEMEMGCYGLGISRIMAAAVEALHDPTDGGSGRIRWPEAIAPYRIVVLTAGKHEDLEQGARNFANALTNSPKNPSLRDEVVLDNRWKESPGMKMKEALLWGAPVMCVFGKRFLSEGLVEIEETATGIKRWATMERAILYLEKVTLPLEESFAEVYWEE
jgi:prolyl-tRNA synthetase